MIYQLYYWRSRQVVSVSVILSFFICSFRCFKPTHLLYSFTRLEKLRRSQNTHGTWHSGASSGLDQAGLAGPFFSPFWVAKKIVETDPWKIDSVNRFIPDMVYIPNFICIYREKGVIIYYVCITIQVKTHHLLKTHHLFFRFSFCSLWAQWTRTECGRGCLQWCHVGAASLSALCHETCKVGMIPS